MQAIKKKYREPLYAIRRETIWAEGSDGFKDEEKNVYFLDKHETYKYPSSWWHKWRTGEEYEDNKRIITTKLGSMDVTKGCLWVNVYDALFLAPFEASLITMESEFSMYAPGLWRRIRGELFAPDANELARPMREEAGR